MDFIFIALAFQLIFLVGLIIMSSDTTKIKSHLSINLQLKSIQKNIAQFLTTTLRKRLESEPKISPEEQQKQTNQFFDCEVKSIDEIINFDTLPTDETITPKEPISFQNKTTFLNFFQSRFFKRFSINLSNFDKVMRKYALNLFFKESTNRLIESEYFEFNIFKEKSTLTNDPAPLSPVYFPGSYKKNKNLFPLSPFNHFDVQILLKRKIKRKIMKIETAIYKNKKYRPLSVIIELPEFENNVSLQSD